jgi:N utilization substance protein B
MVQGNRRNNPGFRLLEKNKRISSELNQHTVEQKHINRSQEREFVLRVLFACELNPDPWTDQITRLEESAHIQCTPYVRQLVSLYHEYKSEIDSELTLLLKNWELKRVAVLDKVLLRMALVELLYFSDIPPEVSINEAIELAKKYSTSASGKFINGLLDALFRKLTTEKRIKKTGRGLISKLYKP